MGQTTKTKMWQKKKNGGTYLVEGDGGELPRKPGLLVQHQVHEPLHHHRVRAPMTADVKMVGPTDRRTSNKRIRPALRTSR